MSNPTMVNGDMEPRAGAPSTPSLQLSLPRPTRQPRETPIYWLPIEILQQVCAEFVRTNEDVITRAATEDFCLHNPHTTFWDDEPHKSRHGELRIRLTTLLNLCRTSRYFRSASERYLYHSIYLHFHPSDDGHMEPGRGVFNGIQRRGILWSLVDTLSARPELQNHVQVVVITDEAVGPYERADLKRLIPMLHHARGLFLPTYHDNRLGYVTETLGEAVYRRWEWVSSGYPLSDEAFSWAPKMKELTLRQDCLYNTRAFNNTRMLNLNDCVVDLKALCTLVRGSILLESFSLRGAIQRPGNIVFPGREPTEDEDLLLALLDCKNTLTSLWISHGTTGHWMPFTSTPAQLVRMRELTRLSSVAAPTSMLYKSGLLLFGETLPPSLEELRVFECCSVPFYIAHMDELRDTRSTGALPNFKSIELTPNPVRRSRTEAQRRSAQEETVRATQELLDVGVHFSLTYE